MHEVILDNMRCIYCKTCLSICPWGVYEDMGDRIEVSHQDQCVACNSCVAACPTDAITIKEDQSYINQYL